MTTKKFFEGEDGKLMVAEIHSNHGDAERPARITERIRRGINDIIRQSLAACGAQPEVLPQPEQGEQYVRFASHADGSYDVAFDPAVPDQQ